MSLQRQLLKEVIKSISFWLSGTQHDVVGNPFCAVPDNSQPDS